MKLKDVITTLNNIPNHKNVGPNGESSYEIVSRLSREGIDKDHIIPKKCEGCKKENATTAKGMCDECSEHW